MFIMFNIVIRSISVKYKIYRIIKCEKKKNLKSILCQSYCYSWLIIIVLYTANKCRNSEKING